MPKKRYLEYAGRTDEPDIYSGNLISSKPTAGDKAASQFNTTMQNIIRKAVSANKTRDAKLKRERDAYFSKTKPVKTEKEVVLNDNTWVDNGRIKNPENKERSVKGGLANAAWVADNPIKSTIGQIAGVVPFGVAAYPFLAPIGEAASPIVNTTVGTAALNSILSGKPAWDMVTGNADWTTPIDLIPLYGPAAKGVEAVGRGFTRLYDYGKKGYRTLSKAYNRLHDFSGMNRFESGESYLDIMRNRIKSESKDMFNSYIPRTVEEKRQFTPYYFRRLFNSTYKDITGEEGFKYIYELAKKNNYNFEELNNLFLHNPEYFIHVKQLGIKNPLSQEAIDGFIKRQLTSIRGVTAKDKQQAIEYLTSTKKGRGSSIGDRLGTNGGLYTSNNPQIADRFKNPVGNNTENGYVATVIEPDNIDRSKSVFDQLRQLRSRVELSGNEEPFSGILDADDLISNEVKALEDVYVGRASGGTGGYERGYIAKGKNGDVNYPVKIKTIKEYLNQKDIRGRWGHDLEPVNDENLFVAKRLNPYDDYIKRARVFLRGKKVHDTKKAMQYNREQMAIHHDRVKKRDDLYNKLHSNQRKYRSYMRKARNLSIASPSLGFGTYMGYKAITDIAREHGLKTHMDKGIITMTNSSRNPYIISDKRYKNDKVTNELVNHFNDFYNKHN